MIEELKKLVEFKTISLNPDKKEFERASEFIKELLENSGLEASVIFSDSGLPNVFAELNAGKEKTVAFVSHYDVVPPGEGWETEPFTPVEKDGKIFGRGTSDAKGGIVAFAQAVKEILKDGEDLEFNIKFFCFCDEEMGGEHGIRWCLSHRPELFENIDAFYILDCSTEGVEIGASGAISGKIVVKGKSGHAAYPFKCVNALEKSIDILLKLRQFGEREKTKVSSRAIAPENPVNKHIWNRFSITVFHSGTKSNIIPGYAEIKFNWRFIPEEDIKRREEEFRKEFENWIKELGIDAELKFSSPHPGYMIEESNEFVAKLKESVEKIKGKRVNCIVEFGATDGNLIFSEFKKPVIGFGPIDPDSNIHSVNEFIRISTLLEVKKVLKNFMRK